MDKVSAKLFIDILKQIFMTGGRSFLTLVPEAGLSELYCENASDYIKQRGGEVQCSAKIEKLVFDRNKIVSIASNNQVFEDFDFAISAMPFYALAKLVDDDFRKELNIDRFKTSPILSAHIWLKENKFKEKFYGLIDSEVHWIFNHGSYISITISAADKLMDLRHDEITCILLRELKNYFPFFTEDSVSNIKIIKEKRATFIPSNEIMDLRPGYSTKYQNFFLAGDWTDTGLPATIEGAVKSGKTAAENIILLTSN
ncbi:MAG TPA: FAD-dependent oxidoreductase [Ignavibacteriales bacterium]|nr:FAD-dependent oxidoreductase [Ignavibacteriales bacterium]